MKINEVTDNIQGFDRNDLKTLFTIAQPKAKKDLAQIWAKAGQPTDYKRVLAILSKAGINDNDRNTAWKEFFKQKQPTPDVASDTAAQTPQTMPQAAGGGAQHDAEDHDLAPGVEIVSQEPIVIKYRNKDFAINDQGQWIAMASGKTPHESFQQFLSKQHDTSLGLSQSQGATAPTKPAAPSPEQIRQQKQQLATQKAQAQMARTAPARPAAPAPAVFRRRDNPRFDPGAAALAQVKGPAGNTGTPASDTVQQAQDIIAARQREKDRDRLLPQSFDESIDLGQTLWNKMKRDK